MQADERVAAGLVTLGTDDAGELLTLQYAAWLGEAFANDSLDVPPLRESLADVRAQLADPSYPVWGLRENGRLVATVRTRLLAPDVGYLGRLGVVPDLHGQGLGSAMLRHAEAQLPDAVRRIELITGSRSARNHAFYGRHGYAFADLSGIQPETGAVGMVKLR